jgi:hypothetical protein
MAIPRTPAVVRRASLVFVVIQASGMAALAGAASTTPNTRASMLDGIQEVPCMMFLLCLEGGM